MIDAMANLDDDEEELQKNLDGQIVENPARGTDKGHQAIPPVKIG
jgi:hypothetical protein